MCIRDRAQCARDPDAEGSVHRLDGHPQPDEPVRLSLIHILGQGKLIDAIFGAYCEQDLIQPTFVTDYPIEMSPLCKRHRSNPDLTERFELFVTGKELCNAYSELNDPIDQLERFQEQLRLSEKGDDEAMFIDMDFVRALEYGMPTCSGMGIGIDRLTMFMTGQTTIQDVLFFPQMRPEKAAQKDGPETVSYTHLDVYKRQATPTGRWRAMPANRTARDTPEARDASTKDYT